MKVIRSILLILFVIGSIANLGLSIYIQQQKTLNLQIAQNSTNPCFLGDGGCATVQTSVYASTFGISNPVYGIVSFLLLTFVFLLLLISVWHLDLARIMRKLKVGIDYVLICILAGGTLFSLWLLFVQFFLLDTTCVFCLWVDAIMIGMGLLYLIFKDIVID
jgi:uncharacterized membrane protein